MNIKFLLEAIVSFNAYFYPKDSEWRALACAFQYQLVKSVVKFLTVTLIASYIFSGQGLDNILLTLVASVSVLLLLRENTVFLVHCFFVILAIGIPLVRAYMIGNESMLFNQISGSMLLLPVVIFTRSWILTGITFIVILVLSNINGKFIIRQYEASPLDFQRAVEYFVFQSRFITILMFGYVVLVVYQNQAMISELWLKQKEREKLLHQLEQRNQELISLNQSKSKLLLSLSHDFRNPINAALGNLDLANTRASDPMIKAHLKNCKVSIEMLFHIVSNLLDSTKLETGLLELNPLPKSSRSIFLKVWSIVKNLFDKKDLIGEMYIHRKIPLMLNIDSHFIMKILLNLILNANKYTNQGAVMTVLTWISDTKISEHMLKPSETFYSKFINMLTYVPNIFDESESLREKKRSRLHHTHSHTQPTETDIPSEGASDLERSLYLHQMDRQTSKDKVEKLHDINTNYEKFTSRGEFVTFPARKGATHTSNESKRKGFLKIEVYDSGCGIDSNTMTEYLFQKFSSTFIKDNTRLGIGLGLWITKSLCEMMGGQIRVYSERNKGSQFVVVIPVELSESQRPPQYRDTILSVSEMPIKLTALVVDDDKYNREINTKFLEKVGVVVKEQATNGEEAVRKFKSKPANYFDLIMMDLEMPVMNGKESVKRIRAFEKLHRRTPSKIIIATGNCDLQEYSECMNKNGTIKANFFYRKPLFQNDFQEFVEIIRKEKESQATCMIVGDHYIMTEELNFLFERHRIQYLTLNCFEQAKKYLEEEKLNLQWILLNFDGELKIIQEFVKTIRNMISSVTIVNIIGFSNNMTSEKEDYCKREGIKIFKQTASEVEIDELFSFNE